MSAGETILELARAGGRRTLFVVGTAKNAGKTVAMRAVASAARGQGLAVGLTSMGRDGEAVDAADSVPKPRLELGPGTVIATARTLLPRHPAAEILDFTEWQTAAGNVVFARVRDWAFYEIAGPASASALRACAERFAAFDCDQIIVDGALDRVAAVAGGDEAVVIAAGAAASSTMDQAVEGARALSRRLCMPVFDPDLPSVRIDGALTHAMAASFIAAGETRQIVVHDPTRVVMNGRALLGAMERLHLRCERPVRVVAATIASIGAGRYFEPRAFAKAVADATGLPTFDVYADRMAA